MRKTWTITVDVEDNDLAGSFEDRADEMEYWADKVDRATASVLRDYDMLCDRESDRLNYTAFDFTNITVRHEDAGDYTEDI